MALQTGPVDKIASEELVETLYTHPNAKIVAFTASGRVLSYAAAEHYKFTADEVPGSLSWSSQLERTIAVGKITLITWLRGSG